MNSSTCTNLEQYTMRDFTVVKDTSIRKSRIMEMMFNAARDSKAFSNSIKATPDIKSNEWYEVTFSFLGGREYVAKVWDKDGNLVAHSVMDLYDL